MKYLLIAAWLMFGVLKAEPLAVTFDDNFITDEGCNGVSILDIPVFIHTSKKSDTLCGLAKRYYGDANLWPIIFYDNFMKYDNGGFVWGRKLMTPELLPPGIKLSIRKSIDTIGRASVYTWLKEYYGPDSMAGFMSQVAKFDDGLTDAQIDLSKAIQKCEKEKRKKEEE